MVLLISRSSKLEKLHVAIIFVLVTTIPLNYKRYFFTIRSAVFTPGIIFVFVLVCAEIRFFVITCVLYFR